MCRSYSWAADVNLDVALTEDLVSEISDETNSNVFENKVTPDEFEESIIDDLRYEKIELNREDDHKFLRRTFGSRLSNYSNEWLRRSGFDAVTDIK